jgi:hypothetical protein
MFILKSADNQGSEKLKPEVKQLDDEVAALTAAIEAAIEEAIKNGRKPVGGCKDTSRSSQISGGGSTRTPANAGAKAVGWIDDF